MPELPGVPPLETPFRDIYTVSRLNREARNALEAGFPLIWVEGEISNLARPASGHLYFSLKDEAAQVRCALFRTQARGLGFVPRDGMHLLVRARVSLYEGRGEFQLIVQHMEEAGEGALRRAFEALKARLAREGLFDPARKRPLPVLPRRIGVITSPTGAALRDILSTLRRRFPAIAVLIYPVPVQGEGAADKIAGAIRLASARAECDALILARGGGSLEDLWAFNEEVVARAVYDSALPVVCGVGHEIDYSIADFVADRRAPTPTAAAEMLSPDQNEWRTALTAFAGRLARRMRDRLHAQAQRLDYLNARLVHPRQRLALLHHRLLLLDRRLRHATRTRLQDARFAHAELTARLRLRTPVTQLGMLHTAYRHDSMRLIAAARRALERNAQRVVVVAQRLHAVSPLATLARGYAVIETLPARTLVRDAAAVTVGSRIEARLARGRLGCIVETVSDD